MEKKCDLCGRGGSGSYMTNDRHWVCDLCRIEDGASVPPRPPMTTPLKWPGGRSQGEIVESIERAIAFRMAIQRQPYGPDTAWTVPDASYFNCLDPLRLSEARGHIESVGQEFSE